MSRVRLTVMLTLVLLCGAEVVSPAAYALWPWSTRKDPPDPTPGIRQRWFAGHAWPPEPRPTTRPATLTDQYYYNHYWPYPQNCDDRFMVNANLQQQTANGWVEGTTLYDQDFDPQTNRLSNAGHIHLRWIMLHSPPQYRNVYVASGLDQELNQVRLASVQAATMDFCAAGPGIPVMLRMTDFPGTPAQIVDLTSRKWIGSLPTPRVQFGSPSTGTQQALPGNNTN